MLARRSWLHCYSTAAAALASDHTRRTHKEWPPRGVTVGVQYTIAAQRAASTTSTMNGAQARSAARHIKVYQPIDEQRQRHRAKPPICFLNRCAARRALDKPIGSRHGPRARPCRVRVSCTSHGRTAPRRRKKPCYYSASKGNVRNCSSFPSARLQLLNVSCMKLRDRGVRSAVCHRYCKQNAASNVKLRAELVKVLL